MTKTLTGPSVLDLLTGLGTGMLGYRLISSDTDTENTDTENTDTENTDTENTDTENTDTENTENSDGNRRRNKLERLKDALRGAKEGWRGNENTTS